MSKNKKILIFSVVAIILTIVAIIIIILTGKRETYRFIEVDQYNGSVTLERNGTKPELFEGLHLITDDMVSTGDASDILLLADTDKHILAEENTGFSIKAEGNEAKGRIAVNLMYGSSLITIDNKLPDGSEFIVNTPNAALSVRGTVFLVSYDPETETTIVVVTEGVVEVVSENGTQTIEAGGSCVVSGNASYETDVTTITETTLSPTATEIPEETSRYESQEIADMLALYLRGEGELNTDMLAEVKMFRIENGGEYDDENGRRVKEWRINVDGRGSDYKLYNYEHQITDFSFLRYCDNLEYLMLSSIGYPDSVFATIPFGNLTNLKTLHATNNEITDISAISCLKNLEELFLIGNNISDLSPIKDLVNLKELQLYGNEISDLSPLSNLINLEVVNIGYNDFADITPLKNLTSLKELHLNPNYQLSETVIEDLRNALPDCEIHS